MTEKISSNQNLLRTTALTVVLLGAVGSLYFMFNVGSNQKSVLLLALFTAWVLSPFVGLFVATKISNRWTVVTRSSLYLLMIVLSIGSLVAYSGALTPSGTKPAFIFLVIPFVSWLLIVIVIPIVRRWSRNRNTKT
jgi:hypothetical protein